MTIAPGSRLGIYEITGPLGTGGMGEVYAATDARLRRSVAIKVLPAEFASDPDRLARFEREAHLLASLNHANIAAIHGIEEDAGRRFLVLELVEGETLAERIESSGPLGIDEALQVGRQIAEALEAPHGKGIIHRDLKPSNIKITPGGTVKLLDFGLAKALAPEADATASGRPSNPSMSPTLTSMGTAAGMILGTAAYMSPEQARAKTVDKRADIWAFGCVLFEALTGRPVFRGETVTDILSMILQGDPDWTALPARTPPRIRELLERCLQKDLRNRLQDIGDARLEIERALSAREWTASGFAAAAAAPAARRSRAGIALALGIAFLIGAAAGIAAWRSLPARPTPVTRLSIAPAEGMQFDAPILSPDGRTVAFRGRDRMADPPVNRLYTHRFDSFENVAVAGSNGFAGVAFSPDGRWLGFIAPAAAHSDRLALMKVQVNGGGPPVTVADWPGGMEADFAWLSGSEIVGVMPGTPRRIHFFQTEGGTARAPMVIETDGFGVNFFRLTRPLPDGRHVLAYADSYEERGWQMNVVLLDTRTGKARVIVPQGSIAAYSPTGHIVFSRYDMLLAMKFDLDSLETTGAPAALAQRVRAPDLITGGWFDLSPSGTLLYMPGVVVGSQRQLAIADPGGGSATLWSDEHHMYDFDPSITRDGQRLLVSIADLAEGVYEVWTSSIDRPQLRPLVNRPATDCGWPVWLPDGRRLLFSCFGRNDPGGIYIMDADAPGESAMVLAESEGGHLFPTSVAPDGGWATIADAVGTRMEILAVPLEDGAGSSHGDREARSLVGPEPGLEGGHFSPDGHWVSFTSVETGRAEVYIAPFHDGRIGPKRMISLGGGRGGQWSSSPDGAAMLTYTTGGRLVGVTVTTRPKLSIAEPRDLLDAQALRINGLAPLPDGRFLIVQRGEDEDATPPIHLVTHWTEELATRLP